MRRTERPARARDATRHRAFTLVELLVVLVLLGLAAALAAPALRPRGPSRPALAALLPVARETAVRRGETVYLRIAASGEWRLEGGASTTSPVPVEPDALASGRIDPVAAHPFTIVVSPLGTCALDARSAAHAPDLRLDPLACELGAR